MHVFDRQEEEREKVQAANSLRGLFKEVELSITKKEDVRSSSFHPTDPVLAFGLFTGEVMILRGLNHSAPLSTWTMEHLIWCGSSALSLEWNANGTKLAAGCCDGSLVVWRYPIDAKQIFRKKRRADFPMIVWNPFNFDVMASYNNAMDCKVVLIVDVVADRSYDLKSKQNVFWVDWISSKRLACSYDDGTIEIHEIELLKNGSSTSKLFKTIVVSTEFKFRSLLQMDMGMKSDVYCIVWNEQLKLLVSSAQDGWIKVWSMDGKDPVHTMLVPNSDNSSCCHLAWSPTEFPSSNENVLKLEKDKPYLACGLFDGSILIWSPLDKDKRPFVLVNEHSEQMHQVSFSPNGRFLASTDYERKLVIWSTKEWGIIYTIPPSGARYPFNISWDASSSKLGISERTGRKQLVMIEYVAAESCCATCKKESENLKRCGRCRSVFYCSVKCQTSQWPQHKTVCNKKVNFMRIFKRQRHLTTFNY